MSEERSKVWASAEKANGEGRTGAIQESTHTSLHFIFSFLSIPHLPDAFSSWYYLPANQTHFLLAQKMVNTINMAYNTSCSVVKNILSGAVTNSSSADNLYHRSLLILKNDTASKWDWADPQKKDPQMVMKYLNTPISRCEIQELPAPGTETKSPTSCFLGSCPFPKTCAVCSWQRPDAGLEGPLTKHCHLFPSSTKNGALHCTTFTKCILCTCFAHTVHESLYELFIKPSEKGTNTSDCKARKIHCAPFYKVCTTVHELWPQRNSIQNSNSMEIFFSPI